MVRENISEEMKKLKEESARDSTILGSGSIVTQFAHQGLIDEFQRRSPKTVIELQEMTRPRGYF